MKKRIILGLLFVIAAAAVIAAPSVAASAAPVEVRNWVELKIALADATTTEIKLMDDIFVAAGGAEINPEKPSLVIDGGYGFLNLEKRKITDCFSVSTGDTIRLTKKSKLFSITLKNVEITGSNKYGLIWNDGLGVSLTFDGVNYTGPQLAHNKKGSVTIKNSVVILTPGKSLCGGEAARATNVRLEGLVAIIKVHPTSASDIFYIDTKGGGIVVAPGANVTINNNRIPMGEIGQFAPGIPANTKYTEHSGFSYNCGEAFFYVGEDASFTYEGNNYINKCGDYFYIKFCDRSTVSIKTYGDFPACSGMINVTGAVDVGSDATVEIDAYQNTKAYAALSLNGILNADAPRFLHVQNSSVKKDESLAIGSDGCYLFTYSFKNFHSLKYGYVTGAQVVWSNPSGLPLSGAAVTMKDDEIKAALAGKYTGSYPFNMATASLKGTNLVELEGALVKVTYRYVDKDLPGNPQLPGAAYNDVVAYVSKGTTVDPRSPMYFKGDVIYRAAPNAGMSDYELDSITPAASFAAQADAVVTYYYRKAFYARIHYVDRSDPGSPRADLAEPVDVKALRGDPVLVTAAYAKSIPPYLLVTALPFTSAPVTADWQRIELEYSAAIRMTLRYVDGGRDPSEAGYVIKEVDTGVDVQPGGSFSYQVTELEFTMPGADETKDADYVLDGPAQINVGDVQSGTVDVKYKRMLRVYATYYDMRYGPLAQVGATVRIPGVAIEYSKTPSPYTLTLPEPLRRFEHNGQLYRVPDSMATLTMHPAITPEAFEDNLVFRFPAVRYFVYVVEFRNVNEPSLPPIEVFLFDFDEGDQGIIDVTAMLPDPAVTGWHYVSGLTYRDYGTIVGEQGAPMVVYFTRQN